jgi:hypothetical protein
VAAGPDGWRYVAFRLRRPRSEGRGFANVVTRTADGVTLEEVVRLERDAFDCDSLERPALVALPGGGWRLYVSCATPGSKHWRVDALDAAHPGDFDPSRRRTVLAGSAEEGLKDPVVVHRGGRFTMWVCAHPLEVPGEEDRMVTKRATSPDGLHWVVHGSALVPRPGCWDARGTRVAAVVSAGGRTVAFYDGRAGADENAEERTGVAVANGRGVLTPTAGPVSGAFEGGSLRYLAVAPEPGGLRYYYETTRRSGAHDLRTEYVPSAAAAPVSQS